MEEDQNNQEDNLNNNNNENNSLINRGAQDLQKNLQDQMKKNAKKKAASAGTKAKSAAAMGPVIFWTVVVIVAIIILVGIIMFFMTMPGMVMDKLKLLGKSIINSVLSFFGQDESTFVDDEQIYQVLDYLEEMGYDLKGFGFLTDYVDGETTGVKREEDESGEEKITEAYSDFVKRYIISDNYIYIIKNKNLSTNWLDALWQHLGHLFGSPYSQESTRGLIAIYKETGLGRADENNLFSDLGAMSVDTDKKVLYLTKDNQHYVAYNLDGWIGRYGMPLEFLLSVHVATMMPDLAFDMADTFSTNVNIYLRDVEATESGTPSFEAYMPYIATVTNHWYRNVYYVVDLTKMNTGTQDENQTLVSYDYDYEKMYGDRWTMYEVYTDEDKQTGNQDYNEYATDNINGFKLYVLSETGEYATSSTLPEAASNNSKVISDTKYSDYFVYIGSKEEANDARITVSKKAISLSTEKDLEDIGWNNLGDNIWSAYLETVSMHSGDNEGKKTYNKRNNSDTAGSITQTGEGQRGETNSKIKKMFLINTYFRYNGTTDTAEIVTALRNKLKKDKLGSDVVSYGALNALHDSSGNETDLTKENIEYTASELGLDENKFPGTYNIKDYSGQVSLNQDSLNAFSMLENIHTLDADYIYRDFKELIVELGYFTKEELTDEAPRVLGWIVPDISSFENYPERYLDKSEESFEH